MGLSVSFPFLEEVFLKMNRRIVIIIIGAIAILTLVCVAVVAAGAIFYFRAQPSSIGTRLEQVFRDRIESPRSQSAHSQDGLLITNVQPGSPAEEAGLVRGDILLEMDGQAVDNSASLQQILSGLNPGDQVDVRVLHGDEVRTLSVSLEENPSSGSSSRAYLGIETQSGMPQFEFNTPRLAGPGVLVAEVISGTPAEDTGLQAGDRILSIDGENVQSGSQLATIIQSHQPGDEVSLEVQSANGESRQISVTLAENPDQPGQARLGIRYVPIQSIPDQPENQMPFQMPDLPFLPGLNQLPSGVDQAVLVSEVTPDSPAEAAGLQSGDLIIAIDSEPVGDPQTLVQAVGQHRPGDTVQLTVFQTQDGQQQDGQQNEIEVTLGENPDGSGNAYLGVTISAAFQFRNQEGEPNFQFELPENPFFEHPPVETPQNQQSA
jgi:S1-C subfamily serine protease